MVQIEDCSVIDPISEPETSFESEGSDDCAKEKKRVEKQKRNAREALTNININGVLKREQDDCAAGKDPQSTLGSMGHPEFFSFDEKSSGDSNVDNEFGKWAITPRISADFLYDEDKSVCSSKRNRSSEKMKQFQMEIFFASVIEMLCDSEFEGLSIHFRKVLRKITGHFIHPSYLSEDYEAFRIAIRRKITETLNIATNIRIGNSLTVSTPKKKNYFLSSRYSVDFKEIRRIGRGGFGEVFHVHSYIDNCDYAIKKIQFNLTMSEPVAKIINEVRLLAAVQHRNIVRYYAAWLELQDLQVSGENDRYSNEGEESTWKNLFDEEEESMSSSESNFTKMNEKDDSCEKVAAVSARLGRFWRSESSASTSSTLSGKWKMCRNVPTNQSLAIARRNTRTDPINLMLPQSGAVVMFVQMELCSRTLNDYFAERNAEVRPKIDRQLNKSIMEQLMSAVTYLHSRKIIHRDIKPSNIFLRNESSPIPCVLLGDFGLACLHQAEIVCSTTVVEDEVTVHSGGVGTSVYAAPEQQNSTIYDNAVDVYSAGIVFFELCVPFSTQMERLEAIEKLKKEKLSDEFKTSFSDEAKLIEEMCKENPEKRLHAFEIVTKLRKIGENVESLKNRIQELEKEVVRLKKILLANNITWI